MRMHSMTGYGRYKLAENGRELTVEIRTVNNRYLDINCKLPKTFFAFEDAVRKVVSAAITRGRVDIFITYQDNREIKKQLSLDSWLAEGYIDAANKLKQQFGVQNDLSASVLLRMPDIVRLNLPEEDEDELKDLVIRAAQGAVNRLTAMRIAEGQALQSDIALRLKEMERLTDSIQKRAPTVAQQLRQKLAERLSQALSNMEIDQSKLLTEAAFYADKANIDEELSRLRSHFTQLKNTLLGGEPAGRKLDFLVQELNREANTICSKSSDIEVTELGLALKAEIEKIREQVQNIE